MTLQQPEATKEPVTRKDLHQQVTDTIIWQLEQGTVPWHQPWAESQSSPLTIPVNQYTQKAYKGINVVLLWSAALEHKYTSNEWASLKQWNLKKQSVRPKEKGTMIVYWDMLEKEIDGELQKIPFLKYSRVFNRCQLKDYVPEHVQTDSRKPEFERLEHVEDFVRNTKARVDIEEDYGACYIGATDRICMPPPADFVGSATSSANEAFYATLMHELTHWTGHPTRLDRKLGKKHGLKKYAEEELIAELGAAFLCAELDITQQAKPDHAAYIAHWLNVLKENKYTLISSAVGASKAVDYLQNMQPK